MSDKVRVFDHETKTTFLMPASELAPPMILARTLQKDGNLSEPHFIDPRTLKTTAEPRHPPFDEEKQEVMRLFASEFREVYPMSAEEWEAGFRRDMHPEREILIWANILGAYRHFTKGKEQTLAVKRDIFRLILGCVNSGVEHVIRTTRLQVIARKRAEKIVKEIRRWYSAA